MKRLRTTLTAFALISLMTTASADERYAVIDVIDQLSNEVLATRESTS